MSNVTIKQTPVRKLALLTTRSSSLRCVSAAEHPSAEQSPKQARQTPESISQEAIYHGILARTSSRYHVFEKLLWKQSEDASQGHLGIKCDSQYNKIIDSFSTVQTIVNWGCIVRDLETIIVLVLLVLNFIPQKSHHSLTLPRSLIRDSATVTLTP